MHKQILIIFKFKSLFKIINELENELNFDVIEVSKEIDLTDKLLKFNNSLIVTQKKGIDKSNQLILNQLPIKFSKLLEKINIEFLKLQFNEKSKIDIGKYKIDLNSRYLISNDQKLKLTEKEADIIIYLYKSNSPVKINQLQKEVWGFKSKLETHTVETHIYRLRKKILEIFKDNGFIISKKNGYKIN